jgi:beta-glucanase (GH16 family)
MNNKSTRPTGNWQKAVVALAALQCAAVSGGCGGSPQSDSDEPAAAAGRAAVASVSSGPSGGATVMAKPASGGTSSASSTGTAGMQRPGNAASGGTGAKSAGAGGAKATAGQAGALATPTAADSGGDKSSAGSPATDSATDTARPGWQLVWSDEFDGAAGSTLDTGHWTLVDKGDGFGNNELQYYTPRTDNAALDGHGALVITARKEDYRGRSYTSARLESRDKLEVTYGRVEARLWLPRGKGIWSAFWMLGANIGESSWPNCGEIDIMENIGRELSTIHGSLHGPGYSGGNPIGAAYALPGGAVFSDAFHVFAVEWERDVVRFYVDDQLYQTRTPTDVPSGARWVYDHAFFVLLNLAVGGQWPGSPDASTQFPQTMKVDYVRVYTRPSSAPGKG